jgi:putative ATPase
LAQNATAITLEHLETASDHAVIRYDRAGDQHYDVVSAFIKSVRGSDVDAALHYLARMIEAGEDPRFIARRLMILASEDIGLAHPTALQTAVAAAQTVALIGFPEARITLAQATIELSLAPKSNSAYLAIDAAIADLRSGNIGEVPAHLRDSHYARAGDLGHGVGYLYPHDVIQGVASQPYLPEVLADSRYYVPVERGHEVTLAKVWEKVRGLLGRK